MLKKQLWCLAEKYLPEVTDLRHELHKIPELAGEEFATSALLRKNLKGLPVEIQPPFLKTDVVALLSGQKSGPNVTLRADIDGLPIQEKNAFSHRSVHDGKMHACGHDGHTAMLYGAARILCSLADCFSGSVRFVFQPGEEMVAMARNLISAGALDNPPPDFVAALHAWPGVKYNCISTREGAVMGACGYFRLTLKASDAFVGNMTLLCTEIVAGVKRLWQEDEKLVFTRIRSGTEPFAVSSRAFLEGLIGFLTDASEKSTEKKMREFLNRVCGKAGVSWNLEFNVTYPSAINSADGVRLAEKTVKKYLGATYVYPMKKTCSRSDDFAFFLHRAGGVYSHLGMGDSRPLHDARFDFDDTLLKHGMIFLAGLALEFLNREKN